MPELPITPPVPAEVLSALETVAANGSNIEADVSALQRFVKADKSAVVAAVIHVAVLLVAALNLHLDARDTAILGSIVAAGLGYFVSLRLPSKT